MTRQRQRPSHKLMASAECPYCVGTGSIKTPETFEIDAMRAIRQALHARSLSRLEVVVPADLAVGVLNNRHKELTELEERMDCRIVFSPDPLMKAREFRLNPTFRKGDRPRQGREKAKPVRASLLAPLMAEQAKAAQLARELSQMKPEDLERELNQDPVSAAERADAKDDGKAEKAVAPVVVTAPAPARAPTVWEEAAVLRDLLFRPFTPVTLGGAGPSAGGPALATAPAPAKSPAPAARHHHHRDHHGGRRRRRR
jgi:ribonuclease E